jgi:hypothetical protein
LYQLIILQPSTAFQVNNGTDQISFLIPPLNGATLSTRDLVFSGTFQLNKDDGTAYAPADYETTEVSWDSVNGAHNLISRVDIVSQGSGNSLIEQRRNYALINKYRRGTLSENDLVAGKYNNQHMCGNSSKSAQNYLGRAALNGITADNNAFDFAIQLNTGFLMDNVQQLNLGAANGILIKLYLNEIPNAIFNIDPGAVSIANNNYNIVLKNCKLFGRYNFVSSQQLLSQLNGVSFRKINDLISVVQSSNDTIANSPMVRSLHKMVHIYQPNTSTANNINANNTSTNQIVGLKKYIVSNNGTRHPYNYDIEITPPISELPAAAGQNGRVSGNAEQIYLLIGALNSQYPPIHSLVNAENQAKAHEDTVVNDNDSTLNVNAIAVDYSYGFAGFTVPMTNNLLQLNVESSILTNDAIVPTSTRDQTSTMNAFVEYDAMLQYQGMMVNQ